MDRCGSSAAQMQQAAVYTSLLCWAAPDFVWGAKLSDPVCRISSLVDYIKVQSPSSKIVLVGGSS